jgi:hypothetical protein
LPAASIPQVSAIDGASRLPESARLAPPPTAASIVSAAPAAAVAPELALQADNRGRKQVAKRILVGFISAPTCLRKTLANAWRISGNLYQKASHQEVVSGDGNPKEQPPSGCTTVMLTVTPVADVGDLDTIAPGSSVTEIWGGARDRG